MQKRIVDVESDSVGIKQRDADRRFAKNGVPLPQRVPCKNGSKFTGDMNAFKRMRQKRRRSRLCGASSRRGVDIPCENATETANARSSEPEESLRVLPGVEKSDIDEGVVGAPFFGRSFDGRKHSGNPKAAFFDRLFQIPFQRTSWMKDEQDGLAHALTPFRYEDAPLRTTDALNRENP